MTPAQAKAMYRRQFKNGEWIQLQRGAISVDVRAKPSGNTPSQLVGLTDQRDINLVLLAEDLDAGGFPVPPRTLDRAIFDGEPLVVQSADKATRRIAGVIVAYDVIVRGM